MNVRLASTWYRQAQQELKKGDSKEAIESLRRAATNDHDNPEYALALARALEADGHTEEARQGLLRLRSSAPESGEINLSLARLEARENMVAEAIRYYHNALYGVWRGDGLAGQRVAVRTELVRFLLDSRDTSRALSELLLLSADIPDDEHQHVEVGNLFFAAHDAQHALEQFKHVLQVNPKSVAALEGAGRASFELTDYATAGKFLDAAVAAGDETQPTADFLETAKLVLSDDPLTPRLATSERIRRLTDNLSFVSSELDSCIARESADPSSLAVLTPLRLETDQSVQEDLAAANLRSDAEGFRTGMNLVYRIESATTQICQISSNRDRALQLIARKRGVSEP
jgi:tetratricopeptide (TPR) repeat protein